MQMTRAVAMVCAVAATSAFCTVARAQQQPEFTGTAGKPPLSATIEASWPTVLTPTAPSDPSAQPPASWSAQDIADGRARCAALLKGLDVVAAPAEPIREVHDGETCGAPAPMQLVSIGSSPQITFSPPATLTCDMIVALHKWLTGDVQPFARKYLGGPVTGVSTMSSFSCRTAYSRAKTRLSEHGRVNAVDIGAFVTAQGEKAMVVADWGPTARETLAKADPVQAEAIKRQAEAAVAARKAKPQEATRVAMPETIKTYQGSTSIPIGMPKITLGVGSTSGSSDITTGSLGWTEPSRLGGPKEAEAVRARSNAKAAFLHDIHNAACAVFTTVLGPEANSYHKNHFHLDLAERKSPPICE